MKKSFLIAGIMGAILSTNGHAAQNVLVEYTCPAGCYLDYAIDGGGGATGAGTTYAICREVVDGYTGVCRAGGEPIVNIIYYTTGEGVLTVTPKKDKKTSARATTVLPKVVKKVVYEEIVEDDAE